MSCANSHEPSAYWRNRTRSALYCRAISIDPKAIAEGLFHLYKPSEVQKLREELEQRDKEIAYLKKENVRLAKTLDDKRADEQMAQKSRKDAQKRREAHAEELRTYDGMTRDEWFDGGYNYSRSRGD